ncbi:MAG: hypothetical protein R3D63_08345 [Paracoccaceae bacterium]
MKLAAALLALAATPACADPLVDFLAGQGCTIGPESRAAALAAGFDAAAIDALIAETLADGRASQQRDYVLLDAATCTIRLPDIASPYTVNSPEIRAITSAIDAFAAEGEPGCFLQDATQAFDRMKGGARGAGFDSYMAFLGAGLVAGDLAFYKPSPLQTPVSLQVISGDCAQVPNIEAIRRSHAFIAQGFGDYIRLKGAETLCGEEDWSQGAMDFAVTVQGADPAADPATQPEINAWLWFEYDLIAMAAGWRLGMTGTEKGIARPPLCHYPAGG